MEVELDDFYFGPTVIEATPGHSFTVELFNEGDVPHTFTSESLGVDLVVEPGQRAELGINAPSAVGTVEFFCRFHKSGQNMVGALTVA